MFARDYLSVSDGHINELLCGDEIADPIEFQNIDFDSVISLQFVARERGGPGDMFSGMVCRKGCRADISSSCSKFSSLFFWVPNELFWFFATGRADLN